MRALLGACRRSTGQATQFRRSFATSLDKRLLDVRSSTRAANEAIDVWSLMPHKAQAYQQAQKEGRELPQPTSLAHITKRPEETVLRVVLPFGSDPALRGQYVNKWGMLRVGKLLEELDAFAANIAYQFVDDGRADTAPLTLVTASFDRMDLLSYPLRADQDLELIGAVTYSGSTSISIDIDLSTRSDAHSGKSAPIPILQASTTFVARDKNNKAVAVPRLVPQNEVERAWFEASRHATEGRKAARQSSLSRIPPTPEELATVRKLFMERTMLERGGGSGFEGVGGEPLSAAAAAALAAALPSRWQDMARTRLSNTHITMPSEMNVHGKIFGGLLMRMAFEAAFACGWQLTGRVPKFLSLADISFLAPVEVGTLLKFDAVVTHAEGGSSKVYSVSVSATMSTPGSDIRHAAAQANPHTAAAPPPGLEHSYRGDSSGSGAGAKPAVPVVNAATAFAATPVAAATAAAEAVRSGSGGGAVQDQQLTNTFHFVFYSDDPAAIPKVYPSTYGEAMAWIAAHRRLAQGQALAERRKRDGVSARFL